MKKICKNCKYQGHLQCNREYCTYDEYHSCKNEFIDNFVIGDTCLSFHKDFGCIFWEKK